MPFYDFYCKRCDETREIFLKTHQSGVQCVMCLDVMEQVITPPCLGFARSNPLIKKDPRLDPKLIDKIKKDQYVRQ